jgi:hypothetical protein
MSNQQWTVCGVLDSADGALHVAAVLPGDVTATAVAPPVGDYHEPVLRAVSAPSAAAAVAAVRAAVEVTEPLPAVRCDGCGHLGAERVRVRDALGHDGTGHRVANLLARRGYADTQALLAADVRTLEVLPGVGAEGRARVLRARRRLRHAPAG